MSSNRRARTLRARLITEQVVLLAMVCLVIGVVTLVVLRAFLVAQLDRQLTDAGMRASDYVGRDQGPPRGRPPIDAPGQGPGTLNVLVYDGRVLDAKLQRTTGSRDDLPTALLPTLAALPVDGTVRERDLRGLGPYRLIATRAGPATVVTGLPMDSVDETLWTVGFVLGAVSLLGLTVAGVAGVVIVRRTLRPLDRMAETARRVAELPLDRGEVALPDRVEAADTDPRTEVGQVGSALNKMLGHVAGALAARHASETRVRQFVADASHELRTPLAAISGYAELARRQDDEVPAPIAHALSRVESEAARMTTLVEDLLLLARLDSGRPLFAEPVDLSRLVVDAVSDAQVAGPGHHWRLDLPADPVVVTGDEARLHQVVANLLANGRTHTPPGTTVTTGLSRTRDHVVLTVTDDGPGIPADLRGDVFERFVRGDGSRSRAAGGTGLGLAIVAAVLHAHGGSVTVDSEPGRTCLTVLLPAGPG
ncbi:two-component system, OmpR family, sensor kinase [Actinokineospora alba]|uniref:histidine kinase n=1 Tax=Actinokineospora alba TaxID=504798 RepID=A0A1H0UW84_9PSEU|nr:HAMP domain-containing sensor histidine kinase [Actinokineospora alba]TDP69014.1 two-component system OmpR family sensor kinase [Actinokineospora alba]SDI77586.1 two-component system, OmpR family, sensor kinase [Actinokineospora alba]SDP70494.1 two-component system, OmpR family, sensor kinase [Actinokineospora alba]